MGLGWNFARLFLIIVSVLVWTVVLTNYKTYKGNKRKKLKGELITAIILTIATALSFIP